MAAHQVLALALVVRDPAGAGRTAPTAGAATLRAGLPLRQEALQVPGGTTAEAGQRQHPVQLRWVLLAGQRCPEASSKGGGVWQPVFGTAPLEAHGAGCGGGVLQITNRWR